MLCGHWSCHSTEKQRHRRIRSPEAPERDESGGGGDWMVYISPSNPLWPQLQWSCFGKALSSTKHLSSSSCIILIHPNASTILLLQSAQSWYFPPLYLLYILFPQQHHCCWVWEERWPLIEKYEPNINLSVSPEKLSLSPFNSLSQSVFLCRYQSVTLSLSLNLSLSV